MSQAVPTTRPRARASAARRAFTLVEAMVVVGIVGIFAGIAVNRMTPIVTNVRLHGTARAVAALVRTARTTALANHQRVALTTSSKRVYLESCRAKFGSSACATGTTFAELANSGLALGTAEAVGITLTASPATTLIFGADGLPEIVAPDTALVARTYTFAGLGLTQKVIVSAAGDVEVR